jgi:hypothetical protein
MPTSVLAMDLVTEKTSCVVSWFVPLKYHSPAILPWRTTTRQLLLPVRAVSAIESSAVALSPTLAGGTTCHWSPGTGPGR